MNISGRTASDDFERLLSPQPHAFMRVSAPEPVRRGTVSERFELRDGDCGGSDCGNPRYRSEIQLNDRATRARIGKDIWYGWSFRNGTVPTFSRDTTLRNVFGQWKLDGDTRAIFRLIQMGVGEGNWTNCDPTICRRSTDTRADVVIQLDDMAVSRGWGDAQNDGHICRLFSMQDARERWMDIVVNTNFAADPNGYLRVWVNGELKCDYRGQLVATGATRGAQPNHRHGIFASYTKRWDDSQGDRPKPTMIAYYDEFLSGSAREDVDTRLRELQGLPARD